MCAQSHQQRERKICVVHAAEGRCPAALPADATPAPQRPARCQPQLRRLTLGAWRAPGDAAVSAATAACAMAARCAASRQRGRADSSSEYATCTCARGARAASAAPADGREGSCTGCRAPWGARRQPCRACAGCRAPGRTQSQVRCHSRSLANHNVKKKMSSTACEAGAARPDLCELEPHGALAQLQQRGRQRHLPALAAVQACAASRRTVKARCSRTAVSPAR